MTKPLRSDEPKTVLTPADLRVLYVAASLCLIALGIVAARRLGYWPGADVTVVTVSPAHEPLDINSAQWWELATLPGIGEVHAKAIVAERARRGGFKSVDELKTIQGIPKPVVDGFKDLVQAGKYVGETGE